jgi:hypothetical protein
MMVWAVSLSTMDLSTHRLSAGLYLLVFGVWLGLVRLWVPLAHPVLYPQQ